MSFSSFTSAAPGGSLRPPLSSREAPLVVVGASLGGFDAVGCLFAALPATFPASVVLVQHRMTDPDGLLVELLGERLLLPVTEAEDKEPILPGHVYLAPSDYHLLVEQGFFALSTEAPVCHARPSIDVLFESAADSYGALAIAIVLTGSSRDGAQGARAVKSAGGRVLVQDPATAFSPVAPSAVLDCTSVDAVLPLAELALRLLELVEGHRGSHLI